MNKEQNDQLATSIFGNNTEYVKEVRTINGKEYIVKGYLTESTQENKEGRIYIEDVEG